MSAITEYSATEAALAELQKRHAGVVYAVTTPAGMRDALAGRREIREIRVALERERKRLKAPALQRCQEIDSEARRITAELTAIEDPIDQQIKAEQGRKAAEREAAAQAERERLAAIERERLEVERAEAERLAQIERDRLARIEAEQAVERERLEAERAEAEAAKRQATAELEERRRKAAERLAAERLAIEKERQAAEAEQRKAQIEAAAKLQKVEDAAAREAEQKLAAESAKTEKLLHLDAARYRALRGAGVVTDEQADALLASA